MQIIMELFPLVQKFLNLHSKYIYYLQVFFFKQRQTSVSWNGQFWKNKKKAMFASSSYMHDWKLSVSLTAK